MIETSIPFCGFYESQASHDLDDAIEQYFQTDDGDVIVELHDKLTDIVDYRAMMLDYAQHYAKKWADLCKVKCTFAELDSPREYNFTTDRIFCAFDATEMQRMYDECDTVRLIRMAREAFTSCDGFRSFYSPNVADWGPLATWEGPQYAVLVACYANKHLSRDDYMYVMDDWRCNGGAGEMIRDTVTDKDALEALDTAYNALREGWI